MHRFLFLISFAYIFAATRGVRQMTTTCCRNNCPDGFKWHENKCYTLASEKMTWSEANHYCFSKEAYMPQIKSQSDFYFLEWFIPYDITGAASIWLQSSSRRPHTRGHNNGTLERYHWADGSFVDMTWFSDVAYNAVPCKGHFNDTCRLMLAKFMIVGRAYGTQSTGARKSFAVCVIEEPKSRPYNPLLDVTTTLASPRMVFEPVMKHTVDPISELRTTNSIALVGHSTPVASTMSSTTTTTTTTTTGITLPDRQQSTPSPIVAPTKRRKWIQDTYLFQMYDRAERQHKRLKPQ